jgi:hypothetical protein
MTAGLSGDEPMLPQPGDDASPMISGRGTKVIADARGAYLAGNLKALVEAMNEDQQLRFRQALVRLGIWKTDQRVLFEAGTPEYGLRDLIIQWSRQPSDGQVEHITDAFAEGNL